MKEEKETEHFTYTMIGVAIITFVVIFTIFYVYLGIFGILFIIGCPGLVISICKKAGR